MQIVNTLITAAGVVYAKTRVIIGLTIDASVNGILAFVFQDKDGNAVVPQLNNEGAVVVSFDAGTTKRNSGRYLFASQTKDQEDPILEIDLTLEKEYTKMSAKVDCFRACFFRIARVDNHGVTPVETDLGYGSTEAGKVTDLITLGVDSFSTVGGTGVQKLILYATPFDTKDPDSDISASMSVNEIA